MGILWGDSNFLWNKIFFTWKGDGGQFRMRKRGDIRRKWEVDTIQKLYGCVSCL